jgi:ribulose bisphosphate carboxylase small subunit
MLDKRKGYRYLSDLKDTITKNNRKRSELIMDIIIARGKYMLCSEYREQRKIKNKSFNMGKDVSENEIQEEN